MNRIGLVLTVLITLLSPVIASATPVTTSWNAEVLNSYSTRFSAGDTLSWTTTYDNESHFYTQFSDGVDGKARTGDDTSTIINDTYWDFVSDAVVTYDAETLAYLYNDDATSRYDQWSTSFTRVMGLNGNLYFQDFFDSAAVNVFYTDDPGYVSIAGVGTYGSLRYGVLHQDPDGNYVTEPYVLFHVTSISTTGSNPVPEPGTLLLFGAGIAGLVGSKLRRKK